MPKEYDIEDLMLRLKLNIDILKCFDEFCDEAIMPEQATKQERENNAIWFSKRLLSKRSLLVMSILNLEESYKTLENTLNIKNEK